MNRKSDVRALVVLVVVILLGLLVGPGRRAGAMIPDDVLTMKTAAVSDLSADGRYLLYTVGAWNVAAGRRDHNLFRRDLDTGQDLLLFTPADGARGAVWRPDGKAIAYLKGGEAGVDVWLMDPDGGQRRKASAEPGSFGSLVWSPDGTALAWVEAAPVGPYEGVPDQVIVADDVGYRHLGDGYREGALAQVFKLEIEGGTVTRLLDAPLDARSLAWSPDSRSLVVCAKAEQDLGWNLNTDLWSVGRDGGEPRRLTVNPGPDTDPLWLPDGRIAYLRSVDPLWESAPLAVAVIDPAVGDAGPIQTHGEGFGDRFWRFTHDQGRFFVLGANRGSLDLVEVQGDRHTFLTGGGHDFWSVRVAGPRVVLTGASQIMPGAIFTVDLAEKIMGPHQPRAIVDPNANWARRVGLTEPEPFTVEVEGRTIEGWFFKPDTLVEGEKAPLVLSIHGGPEWMYGGYFLPEFHILPTFGYGVVIANPTGSMGYGFEFQGGVRGDWGGRPGREVMACVDLAITQGWADPQRLAVMGGSYGGYLAADLTTQTDRFSAAAVDRMHPDQIGFWGTTDEKWFPEWEFLGRPWDEGAREIYLRNSPMTRVDRVRTPTLISQGMRDYRCLIAGGEMWFSALRAQGVPARFLRFADEGHGLRDPRNQAFYYKQLLAWFDRHVLRMHEAQGEEPPEDDSGHPEGEFPINE